MQFVWILTLTCFYIVSLSDKKTLNDECHTDKYILIYVMRYLLFEVDITTEFIEQLCIVYR